MTNHAFINNVIDLYQTARVVSLPFNNDQEAVIRRGRSHTVSGLTEDLFAYFIRANFPQVDKIVIDQPMSFRTPESPKAKTIHPDVSLIIDGEIVAIIDLKMDLGRKRDKVEEIYSKAKLVVDTLRGSKVWYKDGITKEQFTATVSGNLKYFVVVVSRVGIKLQYLEQELARVQNEADNNKSEFYFLTDGRHPNSGNAEKTKKQIMFLPDFDRLMHELEEVMSLSVIKETVT